MKLRDRSLLKSRKAQFFVLSAFAIVAVVFLISRWVEPYTIIDTSSVVLGEEEFIFNNIVEKLIYTVTSSVSCEELKFNLEEYKNFVKEYALSKGLKLDLKYKDFVCDTSVNLEFNIVLQSTDKTLMKDFTITWTKP